MRYVTISLYAADAGQQISDRIEQGWEPLGGPCVINQKRLIQAMWLPVEHADPEIEEPRTVAVLPASRGSMGG